ncbi:hypothetical protein ACEPAF_2179 [Sanghuangporus sanghuang]
MAFLLSSLVRAKPVETERNQSEHRGTGRNDSVRSQASDLLFSVINSKDQNTTNEVIDLSQVTEEPRTAARTEDVTVTNESSDRPTQTLRTVTSATAEEISDPTGGIEFDGTPNTTKDEDVKADAVFYLTPLGSTAPYFASEQKWCEVLNYVTDVNELHGKKVYAEAITKLYKLTHAAGARLLTSANGRDARERALAHCAWKMSPPATRSNAEWYHTVMIHMVLDRLIFAFDEIPDNDNRPLQIGHMPPFKTPHEMQKIFDKFVHWKETSTEFCELWENAYRMKKHEALFPNVCVIHEKNFEALQRRPVARSELEQLKMEVAESLEAVEDNQERAETEGDEVIRSLIGGMKETYTTSRVNAIFNNFCMTALALRTLILLKESRTFKVGIRKERRFLGSHETVVHHGCHISSNTTERSGDFEYGAQSNSAVRNSTGVPGLKQSKYRCKIEHAVVNVIFEMALHSPVTFEERMHELIGLIRSTLVQSNNTLSQSNPIVIDEEGENVQEDAEIAGRENGMDGDVCTEEAVVERERTNVEQNIQGKDTAEVLSTENERNAADESSSVGIESRPELILQKEWIRDLRERKDSADMRYRLIDKLTSYISPKKPHEKAYRIDFSLPRPAWYMSVVSKVKKINEKRKRKQIEDEDADEDTIHATKRTRVADGTEGKDTARIDETGTEVTPTEVEERERPEEIGQDETSVRNPTGSTMAPAAANESSRTEEDGGGQTTARTENRKRHSTKKQNRGGSKGRRTRSKKKAGRKGHTGDSDEPDVIDSEESKDSEEEKGPASRLRGKKTKYVGMFDDSDDAIEDWSDVQPDTFGIAYQTDNIWEYEPPMYKGHRIRFENIPEPSYSRTRAFASDSQTIFFGTQSQNVETQDPPIDPEISAEGTPTRTTTNCTSLPISHHIEWEAMPPKICTMWDKDDIVRERIEPLKPYRTAEEAEPGYHTTVVFSKEEWEEMNISMQKRIFSQKNVLIKADTIRNSRRRDTDPFETKDLARFVDTHSPLQALDCTAIPANIKGRYQTQTSSYRTVRSSLQEYSKHLLEYESKSRAKNGIEESGTTEPSYHVLSFLDIPAGQDVIDVPFDDMSKHLVRSTFILKQGTVEGERERRSIYNYISTVTSSDVGKRWFLASGAAGWSDWHCDAAGMCTFVKINTGMKLWALSHDENIHPGTWTEDRTTLKMENVDIIILRPGDILYMKPATNHFVMSIEHSLAFGGHFYLFHHMRATMKGIIRDHYIGKSNSNTELLCAPLLLMKAISGIAETLSIVDPEQARDELPTDNVQDVADVVVTVVHLDQLAPELPPYTTGHRRKSWQDSPEFKHDFAKVSAPVEHIVSWMKTNGYIDALAKAEEAFREECVELQNRLTKKSKRKLANSKIVKFKCVCGNHDVDE